MGNTRAITRTIATGTPDASKMQEGESITVVDKAIIYQKINGALVSFQKTETFGNLLTYADEAAADAAGLTTGTPYQTSTGEVRIKL